MRRRAAFCAAAVLALGGAMSLARAGYIHAKAELAQLLIQKAWSAAMREGVRARPWPWADTYPVARLGWPDEREEMIVLEGGSGRTLAFGPGHVAGTATPGDPGNVVIGGHRDTHFAFLARLRKGDRLLLEGAEGEPIDYVVSSFDVVDRSESHVLQDQGDDRLTLITCYPFDAVDPGGPLRYVVTAVRDSPPSARTPNAP